MKYCDRNRHKMLSVPCFEQVGAVSVVLVGGVDRSGRLPPRWWRQLQSSLLTMWQLQVWLWLSSLAALAGTAVVVLLVSGGGSCSRSC